MTQHFPGSEFPNIPGDPLVIEKLGIKQIILSTETNPVVSVRAKKLKDVQHLFPERFTINLMDWHILSPRMVPLY